MGIFDASALPSGPTSQSIATAGVAPWAQPYINSYLNRAQGLVNQGPTGFQNQVYSNAQNMGTPEQFGQGSSLANQSGQGQLSTAPMALNYGQMGADIGSQGVGIGALGQRYGMGAGANYAQQATNPNAVGAYMNPYIQQSLAPQLGLLNQQQQLAAQGINAKAVGQGAFGGNRAALAQGLNAQNYDLARQQAIGQGYNTAFQQAQQAQQFGANLGLQGAMQGTSAGLAGLASGMQGAGVGLQGVQGAQQGYTGATQAGAALGNIGAQQGQYELSKMALQNQIANQQYNQPFQNLQFMQGMMSGLPISSQTSQGWQAPPNKLSQIGGFGSALIGGIGIANKAGLFDGAGNAIKNWWNSPSSGGGSYIPNESPWADNRDIGENITDLSGASYADLPYDVLKAKGGQIKSYAEGGDVQDIFIGGENTPAGIGKFEQDQIDLINKAQAASDASGNSGMGGIGSLIGARLMPVDETPVSGDELKNLYQQYLGRDVDESGAKSFTNLDRTTVVNSLLNSPEYQSRQPVMSNLGGPHPMPSVGDSTPVNSNQLADLYQQYLGRSTDESGAKSFTGLDRDTVMNSILNSPEYRSRQPAMSNLGGPMTDGVQYLGGQGNQSGMLGRVMGSGMGMSRSNPSDLTNIRLNQLLGNKV